MSAMTKGQVLQCHQDWGLAVHACLQHQDSPAERERRAGGRFKLKSSPPSPCVSPEGKAALVRAHNGEVQEQKPF